MKSYPFTSQVTYDDKGLPQYDRAVDSAFLRKVFAQYFSDGVFYKPTNALQVTPGTGMQVIVEPGVCHIQGAIGIEEAQRTLSVQASEAMDRVDTVVARLDLTLAKRDIDLYIVKGTAAETPTAPALTRNGTQWELGLADLFVAKNSDTITLQRITDTRLDPDRCGMVAQTIGALDTEPYYAQLAAMIEDLKRVIAGIEAGSEVMLKAAYGGSADGVVASADKLAAPRMIGNASFDGSGDITLAEIGAGFTAAVITPGSGYGSKLSRVSASGVYVDVYINLIKDDNPAYYDTICTLPENARPQFEFACPAILRNVQNGLTQFAAAQIKSDGEVKLFSVTPEPSLGLKQIIIKTGFALQ